MLWNWLTRISTSSSGGRSHKIGGQPYGDKKKGADTGIDGYLYYMDEKDKIKKAIISVKGGKNANVSMIRDLGHVIDREKSDIGIFISLEKPTRPMLEEAAMKGFYHSPLGKDYPTPSNTHH